MPWTYDKPPAVAQNWTEAEQHRCVDAANAVLEAGGSDQDAIFACIRAAGKRRNGMESKTFRIPIELKANSDETGEFTAVFSRFNVIDHDRDVTIPGAFTDGEKVRVSYWGHRWQDLPVGRGEIHQDDEKAWVEGKFFLDTQAGQETYRTVKNLGELQEWSYGFDIKEADQGVFEEQEVQFLRVLKVYEVSPVMLGAGIGTGTTDIKSSVFSDSQNRNQPEGEAGNGKPSGVGTDVIRTQLDILELED